MTGLYETIVLLLFLVIDIPVSTSLQPQGGQNTGDIVPNCYSEGAERALKKESRENDDRETTGGKDRRKGLLFACLLCETVSITRE